MKHTAVTSPLYERLTAAMRARSSAFSASANAAIAARKDNAMPRQPSTSRYATIDRRTIAIERYWQQANRAHNLGESARVTERLSAFSAAEIENATLNLREALDKLEAAATA